MEALHTTYPPTALTTEPERTLYKRGDGCYGKVVGKCACGVYITLDNGQSAFAYSFNVLAPHTKVLCTVSKSAKGDKHTLVSIDSVIQYGALAA